MPRATLVALLLLTAFTSRAADRRLAVVSLATPPSMIGLGNQLTQSLLRQAEQQGYTLVHPDEIRATLGEQMLVQLHECVGQPVCVAARLRGVVQAPRVVVGSLGRDDRSYLLKLWLIDLEKQEVLASVDRAILIASRRLVQDAEAAIPGLLRGEREAQGTLTITSNVRQARVTVDGRLGGTTPLTLQLKPGKYQVRLEKHPYLTVERLVTVEANQKAEQEIRMLLAPGASPPDESVEVARSGGGDALRIPVVSWIGYAGALAAAGGAVYYGSRASRIERDLEGVYNPDTDTYLGTRAKALEGQRNAVIANVLFGAAGVALGTAITFTVLENQRTGAVRVAATVGPGATGLHLQGRF